MSDTAGRPIQDEEADWSPLEHLAAILPVRDLTESLRRGNVPERYLTTVSIRDQCDQIARRLFRSHAGHVLITGRKGVGKTALVWQLAELAAIGSLGRLSQARFLWMDCTNVGPEDSRACLETVFALVSQFDPPVVLCLDGVASLLRRPNGGTNKPLFRTMVSRPHLRVIGVMSDLDYNEEISSDAEMLDHFTRIELSEPSDEDSLEITHFRAQSLQTEFGLTISKEVVDQTVSLASTFVLGAAHPNKSIQLLRQACEDAMFDGAHKQIHPNSIGIDDIVRAIAEKTMIPEETIAGDGTTVDFETALSDAVVGQEPAIHAVTNQLRLIKGGLSEPGKPASVMLFAGMTGVGKTELAKRIAELYSSSRRLQTYTMANFTEPHSVSGIIGVPPGYVGFEQGGRLINELNADPYSVFLLDEAEKAHPNVWKPFLNLFDEGWIVDQRGVKAYADRAIFILTTNAGDRNIAQMTKNAKSLEEIVDHVKQALSKVRHERSSQPVFPPAFLARIGRIIVFNPLEEEAMIGITDRICRRMQRLWQKKRNKRIEIAPEVIEAIGRRGHELNERSGGREGGRIIKKLVSDLIESRIQDEATSNADEYRQSMSVHVMLANELTETIAVNVEFAIYTDRVDELEPAGAMND